MPFNRDRVRKNMEAPVARFHCLIFSLIWLAGCGATLSPEASLTPADGQSQAWFVEHWGKPSAKSKRFFGGETWLYFHIDGGAYSLPFFNVAPHECQIRVTFNHEGALEATAYSGC